MTWISDMMTRYREGILYVVCGGFTVLVSWATYALFVWLGLDLNVSNILSWVCGVSFAFVVNKWIVFLSHSTSKTVLTKEISSFFFLRIVTGVIAIVLFPILCDIGLQMSFLGTEGFVAKIIVSVVEIVLNYVASKFVVFNKRKSEEVA